MTCASSGTAAMEERVGPEIAGQTARFRLPATATEVRLVPGTSVPHRVGYAGDTRHFGRAVSGLTNAIALPCTGRSSAKRTLLARLLHWCDTIDKRAASPLSIIRHRRFVRCGGA